MPGILTNQFVPVPLTDIDHASPLTWNLFRDLHALQGHVRETIYDPASHTPIEAHDHDGLNSALITTAGTPNLIVDSHPTAEGQSNVDRWTRTNVSVEDEGLRWRGTGYATHVLGDPSSAANGKRQFGSGCPLVFAACFYGLASYTSLTVELGLTDGHSNSFAHVATFNETHMRTGAVRFWSKVDDFDPSAFTNAPRLGISVSGMSPSGADAQLLSSVIVAKPVTALPWYDMAHAVRRNWNYELIGQGDWPTWGQAVSFDRAVYGEAS